MSPLDSWIFLGLCILTAVGVILRRQIEDLIIRWFER